MVLAMVLGGLRRCEVLGLRMQDVRAGERRLFIAEGKGGHRRVAPVSGMFFASLASYFEHERPEASTDRVFVVLRGPTRGRPLSAEGVDQVLTGARDRAGLARATCHQLRPHMPDPVAGGGHGAGGGAGSGRAPLDRIGEPRAFAGLPLEQQLAVNNAVRRFVSWLIATRRLRPGPDYLVVRRPRLGVSLSRQWPGFHALFMNTAATLGFSVKVGAVGRPWPDLRADRAGTGAAGAR
jgi:Phage integrase family